MTEPTQPASPYGPSTNGPGLQPFPPVADLPPVEAPSAGFIVQLFVIPAVIVFVVIVVWLLFGKLAGGERDATEYVRLIRAADDYPRAADRAAFELASLLQNDPKLASDPKLLGELTDLLEHDLDKVNSPEMTRYVALALGRFKTLDAVSASGQAIDPVAALERALGSKYPDAVRFAAAVSLAEHAARLKGRMTDARAVAALAKAGSDGAAEVRQVATYALGFFGGDGAAAALRDRLQDEDRIVRYNAAVALGRRGDAAALTTLREMLSTEALQRFVTLASPAETRAKVEAIELQALLALQAAAFEGKPDLARSLRPELERLTRSDLAGVSSNARELLKILPDVR
jgi:HEAT repeat protein